MSASCEAIFRGIIFDGNNTKKSIKAHLKGDENSPFFKSIALKSWNSDLLDQSLTELEKNNLIEINKAEINITSLGKKKIEGLGKPNILTSPTNSKKNLNREKK